MDIDPLTQLSMTLSKPGLSDKDRLRHVCQTISAVIDSANRVSLWRFNDDKTVIHCLALLEDDIFSEPSDYTLSRDDYAAYFSSILNRESICAPDARNHPDTECFTEDYFKPKDIYSLMDYIFSHDFVPFGIICCERVGSVANWTDEDVAHLKRVARIVSMFS